MEARGRAETAKVEARGLARARAIEAQGVAKAQGILKKAEARREFNDAARLQTILEKLPSVSQSSAGVFGTVAAPLGDMDKVVAIEQGSGPGADGRIARTGPAAVFSLLQQLQGLGLDIPTVLQQLGGDSGKLAASKTQAEPVAEPKATARGAKSKAK